MNGRVTLGGDTSREDNRLRLSKHFDVKWMSKGRPVPAARACANIAAAWKPRRWLQSFISAKWTAPPRQQQQQRRRLAVRSIAGYRSQHGSVFWQPPNASSWIYLFFLLLGSPQDPAGCTALLQWHDLVQQQESRNRCCKMRWMSKKMTLTNFSSIPEKLVPT